MIERQDNRPNIVHSIRGAVRTVSKLFYQGSSAAEPRQIAQQQLQQPETAIHIHGAQGNLMGSPEAQAANILLQYARVLGGGDEAQGMQQLERAGVSWVDSVQELARQAHPGFFRVRQQMQEEVYSMFRGNIRPKKEWFGSIKRGARRFRTMRG